MAGDVPRMKWKGRLEFLFTALGYVVGLGNLWRFPYKCYLHGGGVYLIPYLLTVVLCVLPMMFLEMALGQFASQGYINVWRICPLAAGIGWAVFFNGLIINLYYVVVLMYAFYYMLVSFVNIGGPLPWQLCHQTWNTKECRAEAYPDFNAMTEDEQTRVMLRMMDTSCVDKHKQIMNLEPDSSVGLSLDLLRNNFSSCLIKYVSPEEEYWNRFVLGSHESDGIDDLGQVVGRNAVLLLIVWLIVYYCFFRGIRSIAKVIYITATFPFGLYIVLLCRGLTLKGHDDGIRYFTQPDWSKLGDMAIWSSAATQALYSAGISFGSYMTMSSFNRFNSNVLTFTLIITVVDTLTSILGGVIVFSFLGHASYMLNKPVDQIFDNGPGLLFISYIQGISQMPGAAVWAFLFFLTVCTLGLDSAFVNIWTVLVGLEDVIPRISKRFKIAIPLGACLLSYLLGLPMVTKGGIHFVVLLDQYTADFTLILLVLGEVVAVCWLYGVNNVIQDIEMMIGRKPRYFWWYWKATWMVTTPLFSIFIFISSIISYQKSSYKGIDVSAGGEAIGWFLILTPIVILVGVGIFQVRQSGGIRQACVPLKAWRPRDPEHCTGRYLQDVPPTYTMDPDCIERYLHDVTPTDTRDADVAQTALREDPHEFYITPCSEPKEDTDDPTPCPHGNTNMWI